MYQLSNAILKHISDIRLVKARPKQKQNDKTHDATLTDTTKNSHGTTEVRRTARRPFPQSFQLPSTINSIYSHVTLLCGAAMAETAGSAILAPHNNVLRDTIATPREDIQHFPQSYEHSQNIFMAEHSTGVNSWIDGRNPHRPRDILHPTQLVVA